jgi:hypothetical protein
MEPLIRRIGMGVPAGWYAKESLTVMDPHGQANVIVSSEPVDSTIDSATYASIQGELLDKEFVGYYEESFEPITVFGGRSGFIRRFGWSPPDGVPVRQIQVYVVEEGRGFTATATTPLTSFERFEATFPEVIGSLDIAHVGDDYADEIQ